MYNSDQHDPYGQPYTPYLTTRTSFGWNLMRYRGFIGILFFVVLGILGRSGLFSPTVRCSKEISVVQGKYDEIISACTDVINNDPGSGFAYNNRALGYSGKEQYDLAIADFNKAIELDPSDPISRANLAQLYADRSDDAKAIEIYTKIIEDQPTYEDAYIGRAWVYYDESKYDLAMDDVKAALVKSPFSADAYHIRALINMEQEDYAEAVTNIERAKVYSPTNIYILVDSAYAHSLADDTEVAIADLKKALTLADDPDIKSIAQNLLDKLQADYR
ncbi:MAG: tetratricopeptide repeat protein [Chloroflexia bacterium]